MSDPPREGRRFVLVDTNVASYRFRQDEMFKQFEEHLIGRVPVISFVTYAEALEGAYEARWSEKRITQYETYLKTSYMLIPADRLLASYWARIVADCRRGGIALGSDNDWWIAATAIRHEIPLLTNDQAFRRIPNLVVLSGPE